MESVAAVADKPKKDPAQKATRTPAVSIRSTPEWKAWLERFAEFDRGSVADVADRALSEYARLRGFDPPPKR